MELVEKFIQSKTGSRESCEDGFVMTANHVAVIDGATNKSGTNDESISRGRMAMQLVSEAVETFDPEITAFEAIETINRHIRSWYERQGILDTVRNNPASRCTAALVIYSRKRRELWFVGDCQALVGDKFYQFQKEADRVLSDLRALVIHVERSRGVTEEELMEHDTSRERIMEFLKLQTHLQNLPYECEFTYHAVDGFSDDPERQIRIVPVDTAITEIVLASDGYPRILPTLATTEAHLSEVIEQDPLCYRLYRSTKGCTRGNISFDDRTYVRFTI